MSQRLYFALKTSTWAFLAGCVITTGLSPALAQDSSHETLELEEVTVTARKKEESILDVPLSITAFSAEDIQAAGIRDLDDVANMTPGLNFFNPIGAFLPTPVIRGMAPTDIFGENNTAIYVDGVYVSGRASLNFSQLDLERIEINKGPQAAMYGRNAFAGAVNLVTAKPTSEFGTKAEVQVGNDGILIGNAVISGPIAGDKLMGRLAVAYDDWDGSYNNSLSGHDVGGHSYKTVQGSLLWDPSDTVNVLASIYLSDDKIDPASTFSTQVNCEDTNWNNPQAPRLSDYCGKIPGLKGTDIPKIPGAWGETRDLFRTQLHVDWDVGPGTFYSLTAYSDTEQDVAVDGGRNLGETIPFVYCSSAPVIPGFPPGFCSGLKRFTTGTLQNLKQPDKIDEFSQEFRFSADAGKLSYDAGVNYFDTTVKQAARGIVATQPLPDDFMGFGPFIPVVPNLVYIPAGNGAFLPWFKPGGNAVDSVVTTNETTSWSVFGALDYQFTDQLRGRIEGRYANEEQTRIVPGGEVDGSDAVMNDTWGLFSWRMSLDYQVNDNWMTYGSIAHAEKPGKFATATADVLTDTTVAPPLTEQRLIVVAVDPELNTTFELGAKGTTAGGRANITAAVFYTDWTDIVMGQTYTEDPNTGEQLLIPIGLDGNTGSADIYGVELASTILLSDHWQANLGASWTDAKLKNTETRSFANYPSFAPDGDVSGNYVLRQPEWMLNGSLSVDQPAFGDWDFYSRLDVMYQGKFYDGNSNLSWYPAHTYVNLKFGLRKDNWAVELWARNLFADDSPISGFRDVTFNNTYDMNEVLPPASTFSDFFPWRLTTTAPRLRTFGVTLRYNFGML